VTEATNPTAEVLCPWCHGYGRYRMSYEAAYAAEIERLQHMAYQPIDKHKPGCDCVQCVPF